MSDISLITLTWNHNNTFDINKTLLFKSFKKFNPDKQFYHFHFNRNNFHKEEIEYYQKYNQESEYILYKIRLLKEKLQTIDSYYIVFSDANDVVCMADISALPSLFDLEKHIIVGYEKNQWPTPENKKQWIKYGFRDYDDLDNKNKTYLNSGMILAKKDKFIEMLNTMEEKILSFNIQNFKNDQAIYTWYYTSLYEPQIKLDYSCAFAINTFNRSIDECYLEDGRVILKENGAKPYFIHDNGWNHGSPKYINAFKLRQIYAPKYLHLKHLSEMDLLQDSHKQYLSKLKDEFGFSPKTIYDVGACVMDWARNAKKIWPDSEIILFEAMEESEDIFQEAGYKYQIGVFSDQDDKEITFYKNADFPHGNSYYKENPDHSSCANAFYGSKDNEFKRRTITLDTAQKINNFPMPDLLKIDVQGCEIDILKGATNILKSVKHLIVELQHVEYNIGAQLADKSIEYIKSLGFELKTPKFSPSSHADADYHFIKS